MNSDRSHIAATVSMAWRRRSAPRVLAVASLLAACIWAPRLVAQSQPFSSSAEYKSMLKELHDDPVRPSGIGIGAIRSSSDPVSIKADETSDGLRLETPAWRLEVLKAPFGMSLTNKAKALTWQLDGTGLWPVSGRKNDASRQAVKVESIERSGNSWQIRIGVGGNSGAANLDITVISPSVIRLSIRAPHTVDGGKLQLRFTGEGPFFGLGERFAETKLDGLKTTLHPEDLFGKPGHNWTYIPIPFLFTPRGLGMYLDTAAASTFDLSGADRQRFSVQVNDPSVDCYFFVGAPKDVLEDYTSLTGRTPLAPPWAYGVWICSYQGPEKVLADARRLRKEKIPSSAMWLFDAMGQGDIMGWPLWWTGYYPNPRHLTDQLHDMGFKALTYVHPYVRSVLDPYNLPSPSFEEGARTGLFVLNSAGKPTGPAFEPYVDGNIDFTAAKNVDWWEKKIRGILIDDNFDGWMGDFGEWVNEGDRFASGATGHEMGNLNPLFYHKITYEISREAKPDAVAFVRSGYAGSQGYTRVVWGGDQHPDWTQDYGLPSVVRAGITAGLSGFGVWGPDIDSNGYSKELWTRWVEFGAMTPIMRDHLWDKPEGSVNLWYDAQTIDTFRRYARLHVSLFPYFYTYAHEAEATGLPIIRHPFLEFPDDPRTYDSAEEYMLGEKMLIAPVVEQGASTRTFYLPKGFWVDYWTGKTIDGARQVTVAAPLEQIPILVRAGSILPLISPDTETLAQDLKVQGATAAGYPSEVGNKTLTGDLTWRVFPAPDAAQDSFTLYDGTVATEHQDRSQIQVRVSRSPGVRHYEVVLTSSSKPREIRVGGTALGELDEAGYRSRKTGWRLNTRDDTLQVFLTKDNFDLNIER